MVYNLLLLQEPKYKPPGCSRSVWERQEFCCDPEEAERRKQGCATYNNLIGKQYEDAEVKIRFNVHNNNCIN